MIIFRFHSPISRVLVEQSPAGLNLHSTTSPILPSSPPHKTFDYIQNLYEPNENTFAGHHFPNKMNESDWANEEMGHIFGLLK